jgi:hypothetical protein
MVYMDKVDNSRFPLVKRTGEYIGFSNGMLDIVSGELVDKSGGGRCSHSTASSLVSTCSTCCPSA